MLRLIRPLRRFIALGPADRRIALEALVLGPPVEASLRVLGLKNTQAWLACVVPLLPRDEPPTAPPPELEKLVASALRWTPMRGACLQLALVQVTIERRRGHAVQMAIGVRSGDSGAIEAHAWVEPLDAPDEQPPFKRLWAWTC